VIPVGMQRRDGEYLPEKLVTCGDGDRGVRLRPPTPEVAAAVLGVDGDTAMPDDACDSSRSRDRGFSSGFRALNGAP
jgi:hypothetical protein